MRDIMITQEDKVLESIRFCISERMSKYGLMSDQYRIGTYIDQMTQDIVVNLERDIWCEKLEPIRIEVPKFKTCYKYTVVEGAGDVIYAEPINKWEKIKDIFIPSFFNVKIRRREIFGPKVMVERIKTPTEIREIDVAVLYPDIKIITNQKRAIWSTLGSEDVTRRAIIHAN